MRVQLCILYGDFTWSPAQRHRLDDFKVQKSIVGQAILAQINLLEKKETEKYLTCTVLLRKDSWERSERTILLMRL